jgi:hypothetical protein
MSAGDIYVKSKSIHVEGNPDLVSGSKRVNRDLAQEVNWWQLRPVRELEARPIDENGVPYRFCSGGHYRPVRGFDKDSTRSDGLRTYCKQCRHEQYLRQSAEAAARAGKALGRYREKKQARVNLAQGS